MFAAVLKQIKIMALCCVLLSATASLILAEGMEPSSTDQGDVSVSKCPTISIPKKDIHLGRVPLLSMQTATFHFSNTGTTTLIIDNVQASCGCTVLTPSKMRIDPGEKGEIKVRWTVEGKAGTTRKMAKIYSNDCENPELPISIGGEIYEMLEVYPLAVSFGEMRVRSQDLNRTRVMQISRLTDDAKEADIEVTSTSKYLLIEENTEDAWGNQVYVVNIADTVPVGKYDEKVIIRTNLQELGEIGIPVYFQIVPDIRLVPGALFLGFVQDGETLEKEVRVVGEGNSPPELTSVSSTDDGVTVALAETDEPDKYKVMLTFNGLKEGEKKKEGRLTFETDNPHRKTLTVSYFARIK